jgi:hypothetical protein
MSSIPGIYAVGNCLHVNDLVDYVSESAEIAAQALRMDYPERKLNKVEISPEILYLVPQFLDLNSNLDNLKFYFRSKETINHCRLILSIDGVDCWEKRYERLLPPEMERLNLSFSEYQITENSKINFRIEVNK